MSETKEEYDMINPSHYKKWSIEVIEMMERVWGIASTITYCEMTAFKYKMRAGDKPGQPLEQELSKADWYLTKAAELRKKM
jgi:hypothetical protein